MSHDFEVEDNVIGRHNECPGWRGVVTEVVVNNGQTRIVVEFEEHGALICNPSWLRPAGVTDGPSPNISDNSDEDSESSEESRSDLDQDGLGNQEDEKSEDADDEAEDNQGFEL